MQTERHPVNVVYIVQYIWYELLTELTAQVTKVSAKLCNSLARVVFANLSLKQPTPSGTFIWNNPFDTYVMYLHIDSKYVYAIFAVSNDVQTALCISYSCVE